MEQTAICPKGMVMVSALMGEGKDSVFSTRGECREIKRQEAGNDTPPHANTSWNSKLKICLRVEACTHRCGYTCFFLKNFPKPVEDFGLVNRL